MHNQIKLFNRPATPEDAGDISGLILGLVEFIVSDSKKDNVSDFLLTLGLEATRERIESDEYSYFVCEADGVLCGVIGLREQTHVYHLFVSADYHKQGVARRLWDYARADIEVGTFTVNSSLFAVPVYKRLGFVQSDEVMYQDGLEFMPMEYACSQAHSKSRIGS